MQVGIEHSDSERFSMTTKLKIAHVHEQGVDMIIVPLDNSFRSKTNDEKLKLKDQLQIKASSAGLRGVVVPVWNDSLGRMAFIAPRPWHHFFSNLNMDFVFSNLNRELIFD